MAVYILKRMARLMAVLLGVTFLTFIITQAAPGDGAQMRYVSMGMIPSEEQIGRAHV